MSKGLLTSMVVLLAGASTALGQSPTLSDGAMVPGPFAMPTSAMAPPPGATMGPGPTPATGSVIGPGPAMGPGPGMMPVPGMAPGPAMAGMPGEGYGLNGCDCATPCDCDRVWGRAEYLLWWTKGSPNPTPLATSVAPGTPTGGSPIPGAVGGAGTSVIMGGSDIDLGTRQGGKFTLGFWFDRAHTIGMEGTYFFLGTASESQTAISLGGLAAPTLMTPIQDVTGSFTGGTPGHSAVLPDLGTLFAVPGGLTGPFVTHDTLTLKSNIQGADGYGLFNLAQNGRLRLDMMFGFRWIDLGEDLQLTSTNRTTNQVGEQVIFNFLDSFNASNNFYGGLLGLRLEYSPDDGRGGWREGFFYRADFKLALGDTVERINVNGGTQSNLGDPLLANPVTYAGGVFTQITNLGAHDADHFAVVPEGALSFGYAFAAWGRVFIGYDVIYISDVARPGNQIDQGVNLYRSSLVQGAQPPIAAPANDPARPSFNVAQSSFWAQGLNLGLELRF